MKTNHDSSLFLTPNPKRHQILNCYHIRFNSKCLLLWSPWGVMLFGTTPLCSLLPQCYYETISIFVQREVSVWISISGFNSLSVLLFFLFLIFQIPLQNWNNTCCLCCCHFKSLLRFFIHCLLISILLFRFLFHLIFSFFIHVFNPPLFLPLFSPLPSRLFPPLLLLGFGNLGQSGLRMLSSASSLSFNVY